MTETPDQTPEEQSVTPAPEDAEPLYSAEDIGAALDTSGQRALAQSYFAGMQVQGIPKSEADEMIAAIKAGQPYPPPPVINPEGGEMPPPAQETDTEPPAQGGA